MLSYLDGEAGNHPHSAAVRSDEALADMVHLARRYHDATASFVTRASTMQWADQPVAGLGLPTEIICHGDLAPYNMIFNGSTVVGLIDFDNAAPGSRVEDVAYLAYRLAPLTARRN